MDFQSAALKNSGVRQTIIGDSEYVIKLLPATKGLEMGNRLIKAFGTALGVILDSNSREEIDEYFLEESTLFTDLAIAVCAKLDELNIIVTVKDLLAGSYVNGQPLDFDSHFMANYGNLVCLVEFALKENFGDFFTSWLKAKGFEIHTLSGKMKAKDRKQEESQS